MIKHILIPTDFSPCAINALNFAVHFALDMSTKPKLTILNAYTLPLAYSDINISFGPGLEASEVEEHIEKEFSKLEEQIPLLKQIDYKTTQKATFLKDAVEEFCDEKEVDLIVMGTLGASGVDEVVLGSNAHRIIQSALAPVLVIPQNASYGKIENMAVSNDYKGLTPDAIIALKDVDMTFGAKLHLIHISKEPILDTKKSAEAKELYHHLKDIPHQFHFIKDENVEIGLHKFMEQEAIDMLVVAPRKKGLFQKLFGRSESKSLIFHTKIPLLALMNE